MRRIGGLIVVAAATSAFAMCAATLPPPPLDNETVTYGYDARGRLVNVTHSGSVNNNVVANYTYDKADNRTNVKVTGVP